MVHSPPVAFTSSNSTLLSLARLSVSTGLSPLRATKAEIAQVSLPFCWSRLTTSRRALEYSVSI